jgi:predicted nucleotidyltransferase
MSEDVFMGDPNLPILTLIAHALGELCESLVFVGGCATGLLLTTPRAQAIRATQDVDVVVHAVSTADYHAMERAVEARGFKHDLSPEAPICRWVLQGVALDLMPSQPGILGFHNRWYPLAIETAAQVKLPNGMAIRLITAPVFLGTKFEAFHGRGDNDYLGSHDLEDIITVIDGRPDLTWEIDQANGELGRYLAAEINTLLEDRNFLMALPGHLPGDAASQARLPELIRRMRAIGNIGKSKEAKQ